MNKVELVAAVAAAANITKKQAADAVDAVTGSITNAMKSGNSVTLVGFGTFEVKERAARTGRNPLTGAAVEIPARKVPGFKPGKGLKEALS